MGGRTTVVDSDALVRAAGNETFRGATPTATQSELGQVEPPAAYPPTYAGASAVPRIADSVDPQVKVVKVVGLVPEPT